MPATAFAIPRGQLPVDKKHLSGDFKFSANNYSRNPIHKDTMSISGSFYVEINSFLKPAECIYDLFNKVNLFGFVDTARID